jgi:hypothetical protein
MTDAMDITPEDVVDGSTLLVPEEPELVVLEGAEAALVAAKLECKEGESPEEHEAHRAKLEAAYADFATAGASNPAAPDGVTPLTAEVSMHLDSDL